MQRESDFQRTSLCSENDITHLNGYSEVAKVLEWLPKAPRYFDPSFVRSLHERLNKGAGLTEKQLAAILKIIDAFKIGSTPKTESSKRPPSRQGDEYYKMKDSAAHFY